RGAQRLVLALGELPEVGGEAMVGLHARECTRGRPSTGGTPGDRTDVGRTCRPGSRRRPLHCRPPASWTDTTTPRPTHGRRGRRWRATTAGRSTTSPTG